MSRPGDRTGSSRSVGPPGAQTSTASSSGSGPQRLSLLVISEKVIVTVPLPEAGEVRIGRSPECEVVLDDGQVSRVHATLTMGTPIQLRDLGSANGTRVRDERLASGASVALAPGDVIRIGRATLTVQRWAAPARARRIWPHDYFDARVEEECASAGRDGAGFAVARLRTRETGEPRARVRDALAELVRAGDVIGEYGPGEHELLLLAVDAAEAEIQLRQLVHGLAARGIDVRYGLACFPADGRDADALLGAAAPEPLVPAGEPAGAVPADRRMRDLYAVADRVAQGDISVLILGETGVGKEVLAQRVHDRSRRAGKPYVKLSCAAFSDSLLESELFGHERGAFTGATVTKPGLLETAQGGTIFLDEVGEMPLRTQAKLLRVLETHEVLRVGGLKPRPIDVRFVAATNRDLEAEILAGTFRQDLYFRLNGATLVIPPLRERPEEIAPLAQLFLERVGQAGRAAPPPRLAPEALALVRAYSWPGNIRELRNAIERAALLATDGVIRPAHLPLAKMRATLAARAPFTVPARAPEPAAGPITVPDAPRAAPAPERTPAGRRRRAGDDAEERRHIAEALAASAGNQTEAAARLGISRRTLVNRLEEFGMMRPRKPR